MREIKFRVWESRKSFPHINKMHYGNFGLYMYVGNGNLGWECGYEHEEVNKEDFELMQFTGLKDKNGKEIYEGDILIARIIENELKWIIKDIRFDCERIRQADDIEVIGNIYENPELLKDAVKTTKEGVRKK